MGDLRDALKAAGLVSQQQVKKSLEEKERDRQILEKAQKQKEIQDRRDRYEQRRQRDLDQAKNLIRRLTQPTSKQLAIFSIIAKDIAENHPRTTKELFCMHCKKTGSTRLDVIGVHSDMLKEFGLKWMIDAEENQKFLNEFKQRVGVLIDTYEWEENGEIKKLHLCVPCQQELGLMGTI